MMTTAYDTAAARRVRLRGLLHDCVASSASDQAARLVEACALLATEAATARIVAMARIGAFESAALALIGEGGGYMLSRGSAGTALASVVLSGRDEESTAEAETPALALLAAYLAALVESDRRNQSAVSATGLSASARLN